MNPECDHPGICSSPTAEDRRAALLLSGTPREVLARIVPGDPLGVRPRLATALRRRALLLDPDRAFLRVMVVCAQAAGPWGGRPGLPDWLDARIDEGLDQLLAEEAEGDDGASDPDLPGAFAVIARPLGLDPAALARACVRFHCLAEEDREAFFLLVLERRDLEEVCAAQGRSAPACGRAARRALDAFLLGPPTSSPTSPLGPARSSSRV